MTRSLVNPRHLVLACLAASWCSWSVAWAGDVAGSDDSVAARIRQLGDADFATRQAAEASLARIGLPASDALMSGLRDTDPEIRRACRRILTHVLELDYQRRLKAFIDDRDGKQEHDLPGWRQYRAIAGEDREARELFIEMQKAEAGLLESMESESWEVIQWRFTEIRQAAFGRQPGTQRQRPSRATLAAMLLAYSDPRAETNANTRLWSNLSSLLFQGDFAKSLKEGPHKRATRALLAAWARMPSTQSQNIQKLRMMVTHGIEDVGLEIALDLLKRAKQRPPTETAMALEAVARLGGKPHAARLTELLQDERTCMTRTIAKKKRRQIQVRDVALAWLVHLTGQKHTEYGWKQAHTRFGTIRRYPQLVFTYHQFAFESDAARDKALERWTRWVRKNPLPDPPAPPALAPPKLAIAKGKGKAAGATGDKPRAAPRKESVTTGLRLAERAQVYRLKRAGRLIDRGQCAEAATLLGDIIAAEHDYFYQPDRKVPLYRQLKAQAELLLSELPAAGRDAYELYHGSIARKMLSDALRQYDLPAVAEVERKYFFTKAGAEASFLLGAWDRSAGRPTQAALYLERLRRLSPWADQFEPALSVQLALCWWQSGMRDKARKTLRRLQSANPGGSIQLGGRTEQVPAVEEDPIPWLERVVGASFRRELPWAVFRGDRSGAMIARAGIPYLRAERLATLSDDRLIRDVVGEIEQNYRADRRTKLSTLQPLVVEDTLIVRTPVSVRALELGSGRLRWEAPALNGLWCLLRFANDQQREGQESIVKKGLQRRLWNDPCFGTLTSNGKLVFVVEDIGFPLGPAFRRPIVRRDGRRALDSAAMLGRNQLAAFDVRTGKLVWHVGGDDADSSDSLAGARFLGPPLPLGEQLYAVIEIKQQTLLVALDASSGDVLYRWLLDAHWDETPLPAGNQAFTSTPPGPPRGVNPVFAEGLIVCATEESRYIAVDLATRALRWAFAPPQPKLPRGGNIFNAQQRKLLRARTADRSDQWCDAGPVIAEGRVLLTPWETDRLFCLKLSDGSPCWSVPREDGLYLAGIDGGRVVVVGRGSVRAVDLEDGSLSFDPVLYPPGAVPSGRGYLSEGRVYIPLDSAEVVIVDLQAGTVAARSQSPQGIVPGNLARVDDFVVSWGPGGLWRFDTLETRVAQLAGHGDDPRADLKAYLQRTRLLLYQGQVETAIRRLQRARQLGPSSEAATLLGEALLQLSSDQWQRWRDVAANLQDSIADSKVRLRFLQRLANAYKQAGQFDAALDAYLNVVDAMGDQDDQDPLIVVSPALTARRTRFLRASIQETLSQVDARRRQKVNQRITERLSGAPNELLLNVFSFHPAADQTRLQWAERLAGDKKFLRAELLLRHVLRYGAADRQAEAVAAMAELLRAAGATVEAARFYALLADRWPDTVCRSGKTGAELVAAVDDADPVHGWLDGREPWPRTDPRIVSEKQVGKSTQAWQTLSLAIDGDGTAMTPLITAEINPRTRKLFGMDGQGAKRWEVALTSGGNVNNFVFGNFAVNEARPAGHLLVVWLGKRVMAIDTLVEGGKVLWSVDTMKMKSNQWWMIPQIQLRMQMQLRIKLGGMAAARKLLQPLVVTPSYVAFQQGRILTAVDSFSGETIWLRDDLTPGCELFGDDEVLIALPIDGNDAWVLSAVDGHKLGRRPPPPRDDRLLTHGHCVLTRAVQGNQADFQLHDPFRQAVVWSRTVSAKARSHALRNARLAILEPDGRFVVLNLDDGQSVLDAKVDAVEDLDSIFVLNNDRQLVLIANRPRPARKAPTNWNRIPPGHMPVHGDVICLDADTGQVLWKSEVKQQAIKANYPPLAPFLTFFRYHRKAVPMNNNSWKAGPPEVLIQCIDRRTGRTLHESRTQNSSNQSYGFTVDPTRQAIDIVTRQEKIRFSYAKGE